MTIIIPRKALDAWVLLWAWAILTGWALSLVGMLNTGGYWLAFAIGLGVGYIILRPTAPPPPGDRWNLRTRRLGRLIPALYFLAAGLALLSGLIHEPNQFDAITYRMPRIMYWWVEGNWHWIDSQTNTDMRTNYSGVGQEWQMLAILAVFRTNALLFFLNFIPFLFLPGLIFAVLRRLGVAGNIAWLLMWMFPLSYCYLFQAAGIGNDSIGAFFLLAAIYYALRSRETRRPSDALYSLLCAALLTGIKTSNIPLGLPWLLVFIPLTPLLLRWPLRSLLTAAVAICLSFLPIAIANTVYTGDWSGDPDNVTGFKLTDPIVGITGNGLLLGIGALTPPIWPGARTAAQQFQAHIPPETWAWLKENYPLFGIKMRELPQEEDPPIGVLTTLLIAGIFCYRLATRSYSLSNAKKRLGFFVGLATAAVIVLFMAKFGTPSVARNLAPYYPLFILVPLVGLAPLPPRFNRWIALPISVLGAFVLLSLILSPSRPLWPWQPFLNWAQQQWPNSNTLTLAEKTYRIYSQRHDILEPLRKQIPPQARYLGTTFTASEAPDTLWYPYDFSREVVTLSFHERDIPPEIQWIITDQGALDRDAQQLFPRLTGWKQRASHETFFKLSEKSHRYILLQRETPLLKQE